MLLGPSSGVVCLSSWALYPAHTCEGQELHTISRSGQSFPDLPSKEINPCDALDRRPLLAPGQAKLCSRYWSFLRFAWRTDEAPWRSQLTWYAQCKHTRTRARPHTHTHTRKDIHYTDSTPIYELSYWHFSEVNLVFRGFWPGSKNKCEKYSSGSGKVFRTKLQLQSKRNGTQKNKTIFNVKTEWQRDGMA